jgi:hypothetical protein
MNFVNETGFAASIARVQLLYKDLLMATVVVKRTFEVGPDGEVRPAADQIAVSEGDVEDELGTLDGDIVPIKSCCDVAVLGKAYAPEGAAVTTSQVDMRVGQLQRRLMVYGDRRWERDGGGFRASAPALFTSMPLTYERAFGGSAIWYGKMAGPYADNAKGRGYLKRIDDVEGTLLPNVEEADQLIRSWEDAPLPGALAPVPRSSALRGIRGVAIDKEAMTTRLEPAFFTCAHPRMQMPSYPAGSTADLRGMRPEGQWIFRLPEVAVSVGVELGGARYELPLVVDTLVMLPEQRRFFVVARRALVYQFVARRERRIHLIARQADGGLNASTIAEQKISTSPRIIFEPETSGPLPLPLEMLVAMNPIEGIVERLPLCISE